MSSASPITPPSVLRSHRNSRAGRHIQKTKNISFRPPDCCTLPTRARGADAQANVAPTWPRRGESHRRRIGDSVRWPLALRHSSVTAVL